MIVSALMSGEAMSRHAYDFDPTPQRPIVRMYPAIEWLNSPACWVRDDGTDTLDQNIIADIPGDEINQHSIEAGYRRGMYWRNAGFDKDRTIYIFGPTAGLRWEGAG